MTEMEVKQIHDFLYTYSDAFLRDVNFDKYNYDNLNMTQIRTLLFIGFYAGSTMSQISDMVSLEKGSFTPVATKLLNMDYIKAVKTSDDKRKTLLELSAKGSQLVEAVKSEYVTFLQTKLSKLTSREQNELFNCLTKVAGLLARVNN